MRSFASAQDDGGEALQDDERKGSGLRMTTI